MQALNDRDLKFVKDLEKAGKLSSTKQDLQKVIDSQEFEEWYNNLESKFNSANKIIGETYQAALALGLKGKDAERAGRVVQWAGQLTSIALSFASSNPIGYVSGVIQSIGFIGGLFGKRKKEDPVLKALQQISTQLNKIHKDMVSGFNHLDKKLDKLAELNVELYQNIVSAMEQQTKFQQKWFIHISNELAASRKNQELILRKQNDILEFIKNESEKEIGILRDYEKDRIGLHGNYFANYEDYLQTYNNVTGFSSGLIALNSIVSNIRNNNELSYFSIIADKISDNPSLTYFEVTELYEPCKILFDSFYEVNKWQKIAFNSLLLPTYKLNDNNQTYDLVNNLGELSNIHKISKLDRTYLSPNSLATISHLYITYCHYFEIQKNTTTVEPGDYNYYLELDDRSREIRVNEIIKKLESLLDLTNRGIAQQAVMSGHLLLFKIQNILYNGLYPELYDKVIGALRSNYILSHNFVKYLLHPKLDSTNKIEKYKNAFKANSVAILSGFLNYEVSLDDNQKLQIQLTSDFKTYLPNSKEILNNEMLYPSDLELLLATKQKLIQKKMDMEFGKAFA